MLHKRLIINGEEFPLAAAQSGRGAPCETTPGCVGVTYMDEDTGEMYKCTRCEDDCTEWEPIGSDAELEAKVADLEKRLEEHINPYVNISISASGLGTYEKGVTVNQVTVKWSYNRTPQSLTISGPGIEGTKVLAVTDKSYTIPTSLGITWENTKNFKWTITVTGDRGEVRSATTSPITFQNGIYWGAAAQPAAVDRDFLINVLGKQKKELTGTKNRTVNVSGGDGLYFWYAYPKRLGTSLFNIGGFDYEYDLTAFLFENQHGYEEEYYVYRSGQYAPASLSVTVKDGG